MSSKWPLLLGFLSKQMIVSPLGVEGNLCLSTAKMASSFFSLESSLTVRQKSVYFYAAISILLNFVFQLFSAFVSI